MSETLSVDADGVMDVQMSYKSVKMVMDGPMGHMEFDSANPKPTDPNKPQEKMMTAMVSAMAGCKFPMTVKPTGETSNIRGIEDMLAKVKKTIPTGPGMEGVDKLLDKMFDEKKLGELSGNMMGAFPSEPIAVGDAWYDTQSINLMMPIAVSYTHLTLPTKRIV